MRRGRPTRSIALALCAALASAHASQGIAPAGSRAACTGQEPQDEVEDKLPPKLKAWPKLGSQYFHQSSTEKRVTVKTDKAAAFDRDDIR